MKKDIKDINSIKKIIAISMNDNTKTTNNNESYIDNQMKKVEDWESATCPRCHMNMWRPKRLNDKGERITFACPNCGYKERGKNLNAEQRKMELEARANKCLGYFKKYSLHAINHFSQKTFKQYKATNQEMQNVKYKSEQIAKQIINGKTVHCLLIGSTGVGKTHLASSIANKVMIDSNYYMKVIFISVDIMAETKKLAINDKEARDKINGIIAQLDKADLVVLDDLGAEYNTDWNKELINNIMQIREDKNLVVTTNLKYDSDNGNSFDRYSDRITSRLANHMKGNVITFNNIPDYRRK